MSRFLLLARAREQARLAFVSQPSKNAWPLSGLQFTSSPSMNLLNIVLTKSSPLIVLRLFARAFAQAFMQRSRTALFKAPMADSLQFMSMPLMVERTRLMTTRDDPGPFVTPATAGADCVGDGTSFSVSRFSWLSVIGIVESEEVIV